MGNHFDRQPAILPLLEAQAVQSPLVLETGWMVIGHVDEFVQFMPFNKTLGFTVAIADNHSAMDVLQSARAAVGGRHPRHQLQQHRGRRELLPRSRGHGHDGRRATD
ncbi:peptidylarginine deiminase [Apiospora marii]|uniref:Peptidylarginine deiminase n=1 Tax=Apiospora marii TaxID=335849 RepID=A0ABR1SU31_9PEZI